MNGKLIVLEGIDGSGKATQSGLLEDHLIKSGKDVMHISFPDYGSPSSSMLNMRSVKARRSPSKKGGSLPRMMP